MTVVLSAGLRQLLGHGTGAPADTPGEAFEFQHSVRCADGRRLLVLHNGMLVLHNSMLALPDPPGSAPSGTVILVEITARREAERHRQALAGVDESTGLANRAALLLRIGAAVRAGHQQHSGCCLLSTEVPRIIELGVRLGLSAGDALSQAIMLLVCQPQVSLVNGNTVGAEALLRWQSAVWGTVPPEEFVPVTERSGLIVAFGDWVIQQVCGQVRRWRTAGPPPIRVSINLSGLVQAGLRAQVRPLRGLCPPDRRLSTAGSASRWPRPAPSAPAHTRTAPG